MAKHSKKTLAVQQFVSDDQVNVRLSDNYDLDSLEPQMIGAGRMLNPLVVEPILSGENAGKFLILQGNRRWRTIMRILASDKYDASVKAGFSKLDCIVWEELTEGERERIIHDHGTSKGLNREETVLAVWRLAKQFRTNREIGDLMFSQLGQMGDSKKLNSVPTGVKEREEYLSKWFRGTLDQYIIYGCSMGSYIQQQFLLTQRKLDGRLPKENSGWELDCTRTRMGKLNSAKKTDSSADGKGWSAEQGGETFNALIERYKQEDKGVASGDDEPKRLANSVIDKQIDIFTSPELKNALRATLGDKTAATALPVIDEQLTRAAVVRDILSKSFDRIKSEEMKGFVRALLSTGPAADVGEALAPFLAPSAD